MAITDESIPLFIKAIENCLMIRELHVYGWEIPLGEKGRVQHRGVGRQLMEKALNIAKGCKAKKIAVISGVGSREYFRKFGFKLEGEYMIHSIQ